MIYIKLFQTDEERQACTDTYEYLSYTVETDEVNIHEEESHDYSQDYLTFVARSSGTFQFSGYSSGATANTIQYSTDNGETWSEPSTSATINVNSDNKVMWKGSDMTPAPAPQPWESKPKIGLGLFSESTATFDIEGNIMSLLYGDNFVGKTTINVDRIFGSLFRQSKCIDANNLVLPTVMSASACTQMFSDCTSLTTAPQLPATTLADSCYYQMFSNCTSLTTAPQLPATTLTDSCYYYMFSGCTSLTTAPELPATTLANYCYMRMFTDCTSLATAPSVLPATTLAYNCYNMMFKGCTSLTIAPSVLPSTTLAESCYEYMFNGCTSLTTAPELPATTLVQDCYAYMFVNCTNLNYIKMLATDISATRCLSSWVNNVAASGNFIKNADAPSSLSSYIPNGWTVQDA